jgi:prevent-host-death family protein
MKTIPAGEFKARCLKLMDRVRETREPLLITKRGVPVAKLVPVANSPRGILGCMAGTIEIVGDIVSPLTSPEDWDALR